MTFEAVSSRKLLSHDYPEIFIYDFAKYFQQGKQTKTYGCQFT